jgi:hypothetical protein
MTGMEHDAVWNQKAGDSLHSNRLLGQEMESESQYGNTHEDSDPWKESNPQDYEAGSNHKQGHGYDQAG